MIKNGVATIRGVVSQKFGLYDQVNCSDIYTRVGSYLSFTKDNLI